MKVIITVSVMAVFCCLIISQTYAIDISEVGAKFEKKTLVPEYTGKREAGSPRTLTGRVLLVDDYLERDDGGNPLIHQERRRFYQRWGVYNFDYDVWSIADSGWISYETFNSYDAVVFASDGEVGDSDGTWWYEIGGPGYSSLHQYMENGGRLLAIGQLILTWIYNTNPPEPGDFEYDWFGIDSDGNMGWDYWWWFTWAIGSEPGYPDSMEIDVVRLPDQEDYACNIISLRDDVDTLFLWGLDVYGDEPIPYMDPVAIIYRPEGEAISALINFSLYFMPEDSARITMTNILLDEFDCTYYEDPAPLPPWHVGVESIIESGLYLTWNQINEEDVADINIHRSINGGEYSLLTTLDADAVEYIDEDVVNGSLYGYKLMCVDQVEQESDFSIEVSEYAGRPPAPENLTAESLDEEVMLGWDHPGGEGIESFRIYRRTGPIDTFDQIAELLESETSYADYDVVNRNAYYYYVTSLTEYGIESFSSDTVLAFPHAPGRTGILVVNGIDWQTYSQAIPLYQNHSFTGSFPYKFWDLFDNMPIEDFPDPDDVLGWGEFPSMFFDIFLTIVWVGNNFNGDFVHWENNQDNIMSFLESGGNIILPPRYGESWFFEELANYCGIVPDSWVTPGADNLTARHDSLTDITAGTGQSLWNIPLTDNPDNVWIYEAVNVAPGLHAGFITLPNGIGGGGAFCYIAGRSIRWNFDDLRDNFEVIHRYFLFNNCGHYVVGDFNGNGVFNIADIINSFSKIKVGSPEPAMMCTCPPGSGDRWAVSMDLNNSCDFNLADIIDGFSRLKNGSPDLIPCELCPPGGWSPVSPGNDMPSVIPKLETKARINTGIDQE
ncbi:MAG: hypothetical protein V3W18_14175 [candidate division Zixibacteria bacterium]